MAQAQDTAIDQAIRDYFREALDWVDRALARTPGDEDAKALRHTILLANAASAAWIGWGTAAAPGSSGAR